MNPWPKQSDVLAYRSPYGDPRGRGGATASDAWRRANLVTVKPPFAMAMGAIRITAIPIHKHCAGSLQRVLDDIWRRAGRDQKVIDAWGMSVFSGSFNYRPMRGLGTLSMHAFGCAVDFDAPRNGLGDPTPHFAKCPEVLAAFKAEGWTWGGDWDGDGSMADQRRHDGMHWQATQPVGG
jgi:hypothetical protein